MTNVAYIKKYIFEFMSIITIGFPFVVYKILFGCMILNVSPSPLAFVCGAFFLVWGGFDLILNAISLIRIVLHGTIESPVCLFSLLFSKRNKGMGEALDMMVSFSLVAIVVGGNLFYLLGSEFLPFWNIATVINVLGAGGARLGSVFINKHIP